MGVESFGRRRPEPENVPVVVLPPMVLPLTLNVTIDPQVLDGLVAQIRAAWKAAVLGGIGDAMGAMGDLSAPDLEHPDVDAGG